MKRHFAKRGLLMASILLVASLAAFSQEVSSSITGEVKDATGAALTDVNVTARDMDRGVTYTAITNAEGIYFFPRIPAGRYELRFEKTGFRAAVRADVQVVINQRARINVGLELGAVTESIDVQGQAPLLQTDTTMVASTISSNQLENVPLLSRNFIRMTLTAPGVTTTDPSGFINDRRTGGGGRPYVNGNRKEANNFLLDGIDNNQVSDNLTSYQPNLDAIEEVKMITNNASAEFGNFQGGIISVNLKRGTNDFHGSLFEYFRNDKLNANAWARNWNVQPNGEALPRTAVRYNGFGGTIGGPIVRDRLFFFADYQGIRRPTPPTVTTFTVMPADFRQGDFSRLLNPTSDPALAGRQPLQLFNPFAVNPDGSRQPFPNNQIPQSLISPVARALFNDTQNYPLPLNNALRFNQLNSTSSNLTTDQGDIRADWRITNNDDFSARYSQGEQSQPGFNSFPLVFNTFNESPFKAGVLNWTHIVSPNVVNEARAGVNRITLHNGGSNKEGFGNLNAAYGIAGVNSDGLLSLGFGANTFNNGIGSANIGTQQLFANTTYHFADNLTITHGRHMMKMGGQGLRQQMNTFYAGNNGRTGFMNYSGRWTGINSSQLAWSDADFLLGLPEVIGRGVDTGTWGHRKWIYGIYFQDDWRVTDRLTLNLGVRWEYHTPLVEVKDRQANFEPFSGRLLLAGQDGNSRALYEPFRKDFQPRVGFAWQAPHQFVIRGAYTISSFMEGTGTNLRLPLNPPFNAEFEGRYDNPTLSLPGSTSSDGLSLLQRQDPFRGTNIRLWDPFVRPANTQQWNFTLEKQLSNLLVGSVGYVGQKGHHLVVPMPYFQRQLVGQDASGNPITLRSPYLSGNPMLSNITQISGTESNGNQQYHALQATATKRLGQGLEFQANYTFAKGLSDAIGYYGEGGQAASQSAYWQYLYDRRAEWGPTYFDVRHTFNFSHVWAIPAGKGQKWGNNWNAALNGVLGNWQLGGILTFRSGFPLTITGPDNSGTLSRGARASVVGEGGNTLENVGPGAKWFDTSPYIAAPRGTLGTVGVGTERGPGWKTYDISVQKQFPFKERFRFEVRGEAINLFNTPQFNAPVRSVTAATFAEITGAQYERQVSLALRFHF